jgi:hypothetical protein
MHLEAFERAVGNRTNPILRRKCGEVLDETRVERGLWPGASPFFAVVTGNRKHLFRTKKAKLPPLSEAYPRFNLSDGQIVSVGPGLSMGFPFCAGA